MGSNVQRRHWCWTLWLADDASIEEAEATARTIFDSRRVRYSVCQAERPKLGGRIHLQGYTEFTHSLRMSEVKKTFGYSTIHLEPREGSRADARNYCMRKTWKGATKGRVGGPWEQGRWISDIVGSSPVRKSHSDTAIECLLQGMTPTQIAASNPKAFFTHSRKIMDTFEALQKAAQDGIWDYKSSNLQEEE